MVRNQDNTQRRRNPACSIYEEGDSVKVILEMPGVDKTGLEIRIEGSELLVMGRGPEADAGEAATYLLRERPRGAFYKSFAVDETIDRDSVDARLSNGILTLSLKVKEAAKPRRIEIA